MNYKLPKSARLCSKKQIDLLYAKGKTVLVYPLKFTYLRPDNPKTDDTEFVVINNAYPKTLAMFTVPKRNFKRANKRNLLKRQMREAYRLHKIILKSTVEKSDLIVSLSYIAKEICLYSEIEKAVIKGLGLIQKANVVVI